MLDFVRRNFRYFTEISLWLSLIGFAIGGAVIGGMAGKSGYGVLGFIVGAFVGMIVIIWFGGVVATFVEMGADVKEIRNGLYRIQKNMGIMALPQTMPSVSSSSIVSGMTDADVSTVGYTPTVDPDIILDLESVDSKITEFDVILKSAGAEKMTVVEVMLNVLDISLTEAKSIASYAPKLLKGACSKDEARTIKDAIECVGGQVVFKIAKK